MTENVESIRTLCVGRKWTGTPWISQVAGETKAQRARVEKERAMDPCVLFEAVQLGRTTAVAVILFRPYDAKGGRSATLRWEGGHTEWAVTGV